MMKKITITGCAMWIAGLAAAIIGLNLTGPARSWVAVTGNIVFLFGLGITGAVWLKRKREAEKETETKENRE